MAEAGTEEEKLALAGNRQLGLLFLAVEFHRSAFPLPAFCESTLVPVAYVAVPRHRPLAGAPAACAPNARSAPTRPLPEVMCRCLTSCNTFSRSRSFAD